MRIQITRIAVASVGALAVTASVVGAAAAAAPATTVSDQVSLASYSQGARPAPTQRLPWNVIERYLSSADEAVRVGRYAPEVAAETKRAVGAGIGSAPSESDATAAFDAFCRAVPWVKKGYTFGQAIDSDHYATPEEKREAKETAAQLKVGIETANTICDLRE